MKFQVGLTRPFTFNLIESLNFWNLGHMGRNFKIFYYLGWLFVMFGSLSFIDSIICVLPFWILDIEFVSILFFSELDEKEKEYKLLFKVYGRDLI